LTIKKKINEREKKMNLKEIGLKIEDMIVTQLYRIKLIIQQDKDAA
jgi:hypothetical protein